MPLAVMASTNASRPVVDTRDRLTPEHMRELVAAPLAKIGRGDVEGGKRDFERLLDERRHHFGADSLQIADTLGAFGVLLYSDNISGSDDRLRRMAVPYLARAVAGYKAAEGPLHPDVAVALNDLADVLRRLDPDTPPLEADAALAEACGIRLASLGPYNAETIANLAYLGEVEGLPSRTGGDPAKVDKAAALFQQAIEAVAKGRTAKPEDLAWIRMALARMYLLNNRLREALQAFDLAMNVALQSEPAGVHPQSFVSLLEDKGHTQEAIELRRRYHLGSD
jgi:tetratricopeptide (TPR) repeat protein